MEELIEQIYTRKKLRIVDIVLLNLCLIIAFLLRFEGAWLNYFHFSYLPVLTLLGAAVFSLSNLYDRMWQYASIGELFSIVKTALIINLLFMTYSYFWQVVLPRSIPPINTILLIFALGGMRFSFRLLTDYLEQKSQKKKPAKHVLVVGAGDVGEMIIRELNRHPELNKKVVGLIDDDPAKQNLQIHGVEVVGSREELPQLIKEYGAKEVIIAIPSAPGTVIKDIYQRASKQNVKIKTVPGMYELLNGDIDLSQLREVRVEDLLRRDAVDLDIDSICSYLAGKTVLVTGGGGSIGSELCRQIAEYNPRKIIALDSYENTTYMLQREMAKHNPGVDIYPVIGSVRDEGFMQEVLEEFAPEVVFHAAAYKHVPLMEHNPAEAVKNNIFGTRITAQQAAAQGVDRFVLISTDKAVNPSNVMGASKRTAEMVIQKLDAEEETDFMAVRFGNVLGSAGSVVPLFKRQIEEGGPVTVTHREVRRYFMTIPEAVQLVLQAGAQGDGGEVFLLDMGEPVRIIDLARDLISLSGYRPEKDIEIKITGLRPGEKLVEEMLTDRESNRATEHERIFISTMEENIPEDLTKRLAELAESATYSQEEKIVKLLEEIVPGYRPKEGRRHAGLDFYHAPAAKGTPGSKSRGDRTESGSQKSASPAEREAPPPSPDPTAVPGDLEEWQRQNRARRKQEKTAKPDLTVLEGEGEKGK